MSSDVVRELPRLIIEHVTPELDAGRYPAKRVLGDVVRVKADVIKDGHDLISGRILFRAAGEAAWKDSPLSYDYDNDRWSSEFRVDRLGTWEYTVEAWPDPFGSWVSDLKKRLQAGQDVRAELLQGHAILKQILKHRPADSSSSVAALVTSLADPSAHLEERLAVAFSDELWSLTQGPAAPDELVRYPRVLKLLVEREAACFSTWYELFPRSQSKEPGRHGRFADVEDRIPELAALGFDVIYLPPIHPIGQTHRKGRNNAFVAQPGDLGSPWAIGSAEGGHSAVHPELGSLADFDQLVKTANDFGVEIALDFALQCSPDHPWCREHPDWFFVRPDGTIRYAENPPKKYEDIIPINFWCADAESLWRACLDTLRFWIAHGVKIFRVDNPHTKPFAFWEWILAELRKDHDDLVFLAEAFTRPKRMKALAKLGFSQSYTYFTWKNSSWELNEYLTELTKTEMVEYFRPNFFTNTPDILHEFLQSGGRPAFRIRLLLAATLAPSYGIYSGFELCENRAVAPGSEEYLNSEKYEIRQRNWNQFGNIKPDIARLNRIRRENPALQRLDNLTFLSTEYDKVLAYHRALPNNHIIVAVNLDPNRMHECMIHMPLEAMGLREDQMYELEDLLTGIRYAWRGRRNYVRLDPSDKVGHVFRLLQGR